MTSMQFAIITPSYHVDFNRCAMLAESIRRYVPKDVVHYIIVDGRDRELFAGLASEQTRLIVQDELVPERLWRPSFAPRWRVSWRMPPIRGWIWQQITKLSIASIPADAYMLVDSDCLFTAPFDPRTLVKDGRVPLFREENAWYKADKNTQNWHRHAARILALPRRSEPYATGYVGPHVFWRRDVLEALDRHLGSKGPKGMARRIAFCPTFSEYVFYGVFAEQVLGLEQAGHYVFDREIVHNYWPEVALSRTELDLFKGRMLPDKVMVHINGKSRTPEADIRKVFMPEAAGR